MAFLIHVARTAFLPVDSAGKLVKKDEASIAKVMNTEHKHVVLPDPTNHNTSDYPTLEQYLKREADANYVVHWIDQTTIVTYQHTALS